MRVTSAQSGTATFGEGVPKGTAVSFFSHLLPILRGGNTSYAGIAADIAEALLASAGLEETRLPGSAPDSRGVLVLSQRYLVWEMIR